MGLSREGVPTSPLTPSSSTSFDSERDRETQRAVRPIRSSHDYDTEDDDSEDLIYATSDSRRPSGHKASPSTSRLLDATGEDGGEPASPQDPRKQQALRRAYELGDEGEGNYGAVSRPRGVLPAIKGFFARNNGEPPPMPPFWPTSTSQTDLTPKNMQASCSSQPLSSSSAASAPA